MKTTYFDDATIVAVITPANAVSSVGVIRVSGPVALSAARSICVFAQDHKEVKPNYLYRCKVKDLEGRPVDDGLIVYMKAPRSFTGEDVVEIQLHGNPLILNRVVSLLLQFQNVRPANRGEFSFRAFQNGKIDLSQAEGIADLIASKTPLGAEMALAALEGGTKNRLMELKAKLLSLLAEVEVDIDFSDQGLSVLDYKRWRKELSDWVQEVSLARERFELSKPLRDGVRVALVGAPNSGKSTLFNTLLGEDRSIVSDISGTTRDVVRESFVLGNLLFRLSDTAGIRETSDAIESEGIKRSLGEIKNAHLVLLVLDGTEPAQVSSNYIKGRLTEIAAVNEEARVLVVLNKADLSAPKIAGVDHISISAKAGSGIKALEKRVEEAFLGSQEPGSNLEIGRARHFELLGGATKCIEEALKLLDTGNAPPDLLSSSLRGAMAALGEITGEFTSDDVLNFIFSEFCIGK